MGSVTPNLQEDRYRPKKTAERFPVRKLTQKNFLCNKKNEIFSKEEGPQVMTISDLAKTLLEKAIEHASRDDLEKCEHAARILIKLQAIEIDFKAQKPRSEETQKTKISQQRELEEQEALENLELVDESYRGQLWMTVGEAEQAFNQPAHEIKRWIRCEEIQWQPRPSDKRGTKLVNSISVAHRIDRGHCPPN